MTIRRDMPMAGPDERDYTALSTSPNWPNTLFIINYDDGAASPTMAPVMALCPQPKSAAAMSTSITPTVPDRRI